MLNEKFCRKYGYDILINNFEAELREFIINDVLLIHYGSDGWEQGIPEDIKDSLSFEKQISPDSCPIDEYADELYFNHLRDIALYLKNFNYIKSFIGEISKSKFVEIMDELNIYRRKIAHTKSSFSEQDLTSLINCVNLLSQGNSAKEINSYLEKELWKDAEDIPSGFYEEYECPSNLPNESYDLDGGFIGRNKEKKDISKLLESNEDRIVTITGAGGVGKTAIALKVAYGFLNDNNNPFESILWFSAKINKLTEQGIVPLPKEITDVERLIKNILAIIDPDCLNKFGEASTPLESYKIYSYSIFKSRRCLIIIDNLETILEDTTLMDYIQNIPRPSSTLITSRRGLGQFERRYQLTDMLLKDAITLFKVTAKNRNRIDLLKLDDEKIAELVNRVKCYPLLIKWSIGQICLGKDVNNAFSQILDGSTEIAKFSFNDVFLLLSENSKLILYSMTVYGYKPASRYILMHLSNLNEDEFENCIVKELILTSFVFTENKQTESGLVTEYSMLTLTRGFIETKLDEEKQKKSILYTRLHHLSEQIEEKEKSISTYSQALISIGANTTEEQIAFTYVKTAKVYIRKSEYNDADKCFKKAYNVAPKFSYVLTEYAKFELRRRNVPKALELAEICIKENPDNWHSWFTYGKILRNIDKLSESIDAFTKAKELFPTHLPIFNELGRTYSFIGRYEDAQDMFLEAQKEEKYPNYRHKMFTLQFMADNYKRWAESFGNRKDISGQINKLEKGLEIMSEAFKIAPQDKLLINLNRDICQQLGVVLCSENKFDYGKKYLELCVKTITIGRISFIPNDKIAVAAYFYLAVYSLKQANINKEQVEKYINNGLAICPQDTSFYHKLLDIQIQLKIKVTDRQHGIIKWYNISGKYGVIESSCDTYLFLLKKIISVPDSVTPLNFVGKTVSFNVAKSKKKPGKMNAMDIIIEN